ncbi:linear amide C-N hydrolase [Polynucleobacter sp. es-EL-1]|uniref:linear amide C-N hydrolase n=1 Tax=Polynucleobacter sp. es-EL-1 TaxID=1855652 RepID=UPI001BFCE5F7|nr:linear amide C-N hydrolase [Polynucleobacter sp. es-EL-1]QWE11357.1 linear amide C-N hydrolase [Polynucleobacter sp. es-EL-1]
MNNRLKKIIAVSLILGTSLTSIPVSACTMLSYTDTKGNSYVGRTNEYPGMLPDELTYYPVGTRIESVTPDGKQGYQFKTRYAVFGATLKGMVPNSKQDTIHEGVNDQGMSISALEFTENGQPKITATPDKVLSATDFGTWALGSFKTISELRAALERDGIQFWLPRVKSMGNVITPVHFSIIDRTGDAAVVEFTGGRLNIHQNSVGVLTNDPEFPWHLKNLQNFAGLTNIDKNTGQFNKFKVNAPDAGGALRSLPASNLSPDRFIKAAYYSNFATKATTPDGAILALSHLMNNFDRPAGITIDKPSSSSVGESVASSKPTSEVTFFTSLKDLNRNLFYIRTIGMMNYVKVDINKLGAIKSVKIVSFSSLEKYSGFNAEELFLN